MLQIQLYNGLGALSGVNTLGPNDLGFAPKGIGHFLKNPGWSGSVLLDRLVRHLHLQCSKIVQTTCAAMTASYVAAPTANEGSWCQCRQVIRCNHAPELGANVMYVFA